LPFVRTITRVALLAKLSLEGKMIGYGVPGRLPLIVRFSSLAGFGMPHRSYSTSEGINSISQWRTFILVNFDPETRVLALTFPDDLFCATSFIFVCGIIP